MQFPGHTFRGREELNLGYGKNKRNQSSNASAGMRNHYQNILQFRVTEFVKRIARVSFLGVEKRREGK